MTDLATREGADIVERVVAAGDLAKLSPEERTRYYGAVCSSLGLNPLTQPFQYLSLSGKLVLYATRGATDQLRRIHHVSTQIVSRETVGDVYVVTAKATDRSGRSDESIGAVAIGGRKGDDLCNQLMKAETKAKRRATLAIVGLSFLDETEIETIPGARVVDEEPIPIGRGGRLALEAEPEPGPSANAERIRAELDATIAEVDADLTERRRQVTAMNPPNAAAVAASVGAPGDDVESLTGEALADACDRMRRRLAAANLPYAAYPDPRTVRTLRAWWHQGAALLSARA